jgi:hypothetical protein
VTSQASGAVAAGPAADPEPETDEQRAHTLRALPATDARGRIDVLHVVPSTKPDGSFEKIYGMGHIGGGFESGRGPPVLGVKVVEGEHNGDLAYESSWEHATLWREASMPGATWGSLAVETVYDVTVNCFLDYKIDAADGHGYAGVEYRQPDITDPVLATFINSINTASRERISAYGPRAGSFYVRHVIVPAHPVDADGPRYRISYSIDEDGQITAENVEIMDSSIVLTPGAGQRPWSAVVAYHQMLAAQGGDRAAPAVVFERFAPVVEAVLGEAAGDEH